MILTFGLVQILLQSATLVNGGLVRSLILWNTFSGALLIYSYRPPFWTSWVTQKYLTWTCSSWSSTLRRARSASSFEVFRSEISKTRKTNRSLPASERSWRHSTKGQWTLHRARQKRKTQLPLWNLCLWRHHQDLRRQLRRTLVLRRRRGLQAGHHGQRRLV